MVLWVTHSPGLKVIYLTDDMQCVSFKGFLSEWGTVTGGVSGLNFGFSTYVNDLSAVVRHSVEHVC